MRCAYPGYAGCTSESVLNDFFGIEPIIDNREYPFICPEERLDETSEELEKLLEKNVAEEPEPQVV